MQEIVTKIIVLAAVALLTWLFYRKLRRKNAGCSASGCNECGQPCGPRTCNEKNPSRGKRSDLPTRADNSAGETKDRRPASRRM